MPDQLPGLNLGNVLNTRATKLSPRHYPGQQDQHQYNKVRKIRYRESNLGPPQQVTKCQPGPLSSTVRQKTK